ncbi:MAG: winged helix-turn-helix domain-containing protein [Bacteroidales bacterium]|nr:winged helix-turn-helix domain-containing protein [Bacteroidales bacterium]
MRKPFAKNICLIGLEEKDEKRLKRGLSVYGNKIFTEKELASLIQRIETSRVNIVLAGKGMDNTNGLEKEILSRDASTKVVFLTSNSDKNNGVKENETNVFSISADAACKDINGYLNKIYSESSADIRVNLGKYSFSSANNELIFHREGAKDLQQKLTKKENDILLLLAVNEGKLVPRKKLTDNIWFSPHIKSSRSLDVYVVRLRQYLSMDKRIQIKNIHSKGFMLTCEK